MFIKLTCRLSSCPLIQHLFGELTHRFIQNNETIRQFRFKNSRQLESLRVSFMNIGNVLYLKTQSEPRSKHFSYRL